MPVIEGLDPNLQWLLTTVFVLAVGVFTAWSHVRGKAAPRPKSAEFNIAGQLADMGPVKELMEQTGLLVQQQVRTNIHLEAVAVAMKRLADAYEAELAAERNEAEIETEVERRLEKQLRERRGRERRVSKPPE